MASSFSSVWLKIERAKKHADDLETEIERFGDSEPYEIETQGDVKNGPGCYRIKGTPKPLPDDLPLIAGDAVHNLRSALDHFACGAVAKVTGNTAFPIWRATPTPTRNEWRGEVKGKLKGASHSLITAVGQLQAYETGHGQRIWAVGDLDRIDKHRLLIAISGAKVVTILDMADIAEAAFREINPDFTPWPSMRFGLKPADWIPIEAGTELYGIPANAGPGAEAKPEFGFSVAFGEPEILKGEPVVPALRRLIDEVESLLKRLVPLV
jgi:hypothetical protein